MMEARHGVMLLGEEFGVHLPRALTTFIAGLGPIGAAMEAAFPFLAIAVGATLLLEHLAKLHEEGEKLTQSQMHFATAAQDAFNTLDKKLLEAEITADELAGDHLAALQKRLELINKESMEDLVHQFDILAKAADAVFAELKSHWYTFGIGASGAKHALEDFKSNYDLLLAQGKDKDASDLLKGTKDSAEHVLAMMRQLDSSRADPAHGKAGDYGKYQEAAQELQKAGVLSKVLADTTQKEVEAQETLVATLRDQVTVEEKVAELKKAQSSNAVSTEHKKGDHDADRQMRAEAEAFKRGAEEEERQWKERYQRAVQAIQEGEKQEIAATEQGTQARLDAINTAIKDEEAHGLQETGFYRELLVQRVEITRQMALEEAKLQAEAGKEEAEHEQKMDELRLTAAKQASDHRLNMERTNVQEQLDADINFANQEYTLKMAALDKEITALDKYGKDYENHLKALQNKETELTKAHENEITQIKQKAEEERNARILSAEQRFNDSIASGLTSVIMRHETFAKMMDNLAGQVAQGMIENAIKSILALDMTKEKEAAAAARKAYLAGMQMPAPANVVIAPAWAAMASLRRWPIRAAAPA